MTMEQTRWKHISEFVLLALTKATVYYPSNNGGKSSGRLLDGYE